MVAELRDPAMRPRHWSMLMSLCGKNAQVTDDVLLRDMWNMELHKFPAEARPLVVSDKVRCAWGGDLAIIPGLDEVAADCGATDVRQI